MSQHWAALLIPTTNHTPFIDNHGIALWALQFTPRVAYLDEAVVMDVASCLRLFGGEELLKARVTRECREQGVQTVAWAPNSLAALAFARSGVTDGFAGPLAKLLDSIALENLTAVGLHQPVLARLGCKTLGDVRKLPRGGISRRFDHQVLAALDQAYGVLPSAHNWVSLPEVFSVKLELPGRVDSSSSLLFGAHRLLLQMCGWLAARNSGVTAFVLRWYHDMLRSKTAGQSGELVIRTAEPSRDIRHLERLLAEHLAKIELLAPVGDVGIEALEVHLLADDSKTLLPDSMRSGQELGLVLERVAARLGPERVMRPVLKEDYRLEWMQTWWSASSHVASRLARLPAIVDIPQPSWVLPKPLKLAVACERPMYQGSLQLVVGPHRVEGGWWHRMEDSEGAQSIQNVQRDYWIALSKHAGILWLFQERLAYDPVGCWYLHGVFA